MELPAERRQRIEALLDGVSRSELADRAAALSARYRSGARSAGAGDLDALAYVATRAPATYAAVRAVLAELGQRWPSFTPASMLDVGAGPGTASWAAADVWPELEVVTRLEREAESIAIGRRLDDGGTWLQADITAGATSGAAWPTADLVVVAYVTTELTAFEPVVRRAYDATDEVLVVVEPGTPSGFRRLLAVRDVLLSARATLVAPCPHQDACPLGHRSTSGSPSGRRSATGSRSTAPADGSWCHFSTRVARSKVHREVKRASAPWEEERFSYLVFTRASDDRRQARVLSPPKVSKGQVTLELCLPEGHQVRTIRRSDKAGYAAARKLRWGSAVPG